MKKINVLSLFGGMEAGYETIRRMGMEDRIANYFSAEIGKPQIACAKENFPDIIHIGSVTDVSFGEWKHGKAPGNLFFEQGESFDIGKIDFLIGGPPCTNISIAGKREGIGADNIEDYFELKRRYEKVKRGEFNEETTESVIWLLNFFEKTQSHLFWEFIRIFREVKPEFFFVENVASMSKEMFQVISRALGFEGVKRNAAVVSAQNRRRYYWLGKRNPDGTYSRFDTPEPEDRGILLKDILEDIPFDAVDAKGKPIWRPLPEKFVAVVDERIEKFSTDRKAFAVTATYANACVQNHLRSDRTIILGQYQLPHGGNTGGLRDSGKACSVGASGYHENNKIVGQFRRTNLRVHSDQEKSPTLTANMGTGGNNVPVVMEPYCLNPKVEGKQPSLADRIYSEEAKAPAVTTCFITNVTGLAHRNRGEGKEPECNGQEKANALTSVQSDSEVLIRTSEPKYLWRKLTVRECSRLQGFSDSYRFPVANSPAYECIGNSWQVDEIEEFWKHLPFFL